MNKNFRRDLGLVTGASVVSFAISLVLTPVMTRWYRPVDYGSFALINNLATFLATAFLLSLPNALPMESLWKRQAQLLRSLTLLTALAFLLSGIGAALFFGINYALGRIDGTEWPLVSLPFLVLALSLHRIAQGWANADGAFRSMATARIIHPLITKPFAIVASMLTAPNSFYLICFEGLGYIVQAYTMVRGRLQRLKGLPRFFSRRRLGLTGGVIKRHGDYSLFDNLVNLLMLGSISLYTVILASRYSIHETGLFSLAMSMASLPVQLISLATAPIIYHRLVDCARNNPNSLFGKTLKILLAFILMGSFPYLVLFFFGPALFEIIFGNDWSQSGRVASLLSLPLFLQFLFMPISSAFRVTSTIKLQFFIDLVFSLAIIFLFYLVSRSLPFLGALTIFATAMSIHRFVSIAFCLGVAWHMSKKVAFT